MQQNKHGLTSRESISFMQNCYIVWTCLKASVDTVDVVKFVPPPPPQSTPAQTRPRKIPVKGKNYDDIFIEFQTIRILK